jgi:hypothetical protein
MRRVPGVETLLDLHGQVIDQGSGYWLKIEAWRINPTPEAQHGNKILNRKHWIPGLRCATPGMTIQSELP